MIELIRKTPIWLQAVVFGILLLIPAAFLVQVIVQFNVVNYPNNPWPVILAAAVIYLYWSYAKKSDFLKEDRLVNWAEKYSLMGYWDAVAALILITFSLSLIGFSFQNAEETSQYAFIKMIGATPAHVAIPLYFVLALSAGVIEEVTFRGYVQSTTMGQYGVFFSFVFVAIFFSIVHHLPWPLIPSYIVVSLAYSIVTYRLGSIVPGILAHFLFDFIAFLLIYFVPNTTSAEFFDQMLIYNIIIAILSGAYVLLRVKKI